MTSLDSQSLVPLIAAGKGKNSTIIPYANSMYFAKSISALNAMYNHLPDDSPVKSYLANNCAHLLKPLTGTFTIPMSLKPVDLIQHEDAVMLVGCIAPGPRICLTNSGANVFK